MKLSKSNTHTSSKYNIRTHRNPLKVSALQSPKTISQTFTNSYQKLDILSWNPSHLWSNHISQDDHLKPHTYFKRPTTFKQNHSKYPKNIKINLKNIELMWVLSGNEMADKATHLATRIILHPRISDLPTNDIPSSIKYKIYSKWQN